MTGVGRIPASGEASIPTGADLNWRTVWPGQWTCDSAGYIWADSLKGGRTHMIDVRGWGYLTGRGMGALNLSSADAERIQDQLGALLCAAPDLLQVAVWAHEPYEGLDEDDVRGLYSAEEADLCMALRETIAKATTPAKPDAVGMSRLRRMHP